MQRDNSDSTSSDSIDLTSTSISSSSSSETSSDSSDSSVLARNKKKKLKRSFDISEKFKKRDSKNKSSIYQSSEYSKEDESSDQNNNTDKDKSSVEMEYIDEKDFDEYETEYDSKIQDYDESTSNSEVYEDEEEKEYLLRKKKEFREYRKILAIKMERRLHEEKKSAVKKKALVKYNGGREVGKRRTKENKDKLKENVIKLSAAKQQEELAKEVSIQENSFNNIEPKRSSIVDKGNTPYDPSTNDRMNLSMVDAYYSGRNILDYKSDMLVLNYKYM